MRKYPFLLYLSCVFCVFLCGKIDLQAQQNDSILYSVYLVGDAGNALVPNDLLRELKREVSRKENASVIFLGDNIYPAGLLVSDDNSPRYRMELAKLHSQLGVLKNFQGHGFFIPGNHDWRAGKRSGLRSIIHQQEAVDLYVKDSTKIRNREQGAFFPKGGEPGPVVFQLHDSLKMVMMDSQWWLQQGPWHPVGGGEGAGDRAFEQLDSILAHAHANNIRVMLAMHHPMYTNSKHVRSYNPLRWMYYYTPLRILSYLGVDRALRQDIPDPHYMEIRRRTLSIMNKYEGVIHVAGHDHSLQLFSNGKNYFVVSGSGSKIYKYYRDEHPALFFNATHHGLMQIDYYTSGEIILKAKLAKEDGLQEVYRYRLN